MSSFGPSEQQKATEEQSRLVELGTQLILEKLEGMTREELLVALEKEILKNEKLAIEVRDLKEEKVKLSLILEEEDERRANMFLKKVEELEASVKACPKCSIAPAAILMKKNSTSHSPTPVRSMSMSSVKEHPDEKQ
jgi:hypothetical protein